MGSDVTQQGVKISLLIENFHSTMSLVPGVKYNLLSNIQEMTSLLLRHGCTHIADWLDKDTTELTQVTLKKIADEGDDQSLDFHLVKYFTCKQRNR